MDDSMYRLEYVCTLKIASQQISKSRHFNISLLGNPPFNDTIYIDTSYLKEHIIIQVHSGMGHEINIEKSVFNFYHTSIVPIRFT
jgi:hypothetical protein